MKNMDATTVLIFDNLRQEKQYFLLKDFFERSPSVINNLLMYNDLPSIRINNDEFGLNNVMYSVDKNCKVINLGEIK